MIIEKAFARYCLRHDFGSRAIPVEIDLLNADELRRRYFMDGFLYLKLKKTEPFFRFQNALKKALRIDDDNFRWETKYRNSKDFRPNINNFDDSITEILFNQRVPEVIKSASERDVTLAHVQYRNVFKSKHSYNGWHRDTHFYGGNEVGNIPPVIKVIYYPIFDGASVPVLNIVPGSHFQVKENLLLDLFQVNNRKQQTIYSSDDCLIIFNTLLLHSALPERINNCSQRVIYSFCHKNQLHNYDSDSLEGIQARYNELMGKNISPPAI